MTTDYEHLRYERNLRKKIGGDVIELILHPPEDPSDLTAETMAACTRSLAGGRPAALRRLMSAPHHMLEADAQTAGGYYPDSLGINEVLASTDYTVSYGITGGVGTGQVLETCRIADDHGVQVAEMAVVSDARGAGLTYTDIQGDVPVHKIVGGALAWRNAGELLGEFKAWERRLDARD